MSTPVKWMDAAALDGLPRNADCLDDDQYDALRAQARAALALRDELASVRAELEQLGGDFGIRMNQIALMRDEALRYYNADGSFVVMESPEAVVAARKAAAAELAECRAKLAAAAPQECPECGPHVTVDEDGCCATCGADTVPVDLRAKLAAAETRLSIHENLTALEAENAMRDERDAALAKLAQAEQERDDMLSSLRSAEQDGRATVGHMGTLMIAAAAAQAENVRLREAGRDLRLMATTQAPADHPLIVAWDQANADPGSRAALQEWGVRLLDFGKFNPKLVSDDFEECRRRGAENCETLEHVSRERVVNAMLEGGQS